MSLGFPLCKIQGHYLSTISLFAQAPLMVPHLRTPLSTSPPCLISQSCVWRPVLFLLLALWYTQHTHTQDSLFSLTTLLYCVHVCPVSFKVAGQEGNSRRDVEKRKHKWDNE